MFTLSYAFVIYTRFSIDPKYYIFFGKMWNCCYILLLNIKTHVNKFINNIRQRIVVYYTWKLIVQKWARSYKFNKYIGMN